MCIHFQILRSTWTISGSGQAHRAASNVQRLQHLHVELELLSDYERDLSYADVPRNGLDVKIEEESNDDEAQIRTR